MTRTLNLNSVTTALIVAAASAAAVGEMFPRARVRMEDGLLQVLPTTRVSAVNLPKGELLLNLARKGDNALRISLADDAFPSFETGTKYEVTPAKYGWMTLVPAESLAKGVAGASITG